MREPKCGGVPFGFVLGERTEGEQYDTHKDERAAL